MQSTVSKKTCGNDLTTFQTILDFVTNLNDYFGNEKHSSVRPLNLYHRLISKMSITDDDLILRHINVFKIFCENNREAIRSQNKELNSTKIIFTDRIFIDMQYILNKADDESLSAIWEYLLTISAYVDPENKTKQLLQELKDKNTPENDFLSNMLETMGSKMGSENGGMDMSNPMSMIGNLMNSDLLKNMMGSMNDNVENGKLDLGKLMGTMTGLISNIKNEIDKSDDPTMKQLTGLLNLPGLLGQNTNVDAENEEPIKKEEEETEQPTKEDELNVD